MIRKTPCLAIAVLSLLASPFVASAQSHPRLLFGPQDVATLRAKAQSSHAAIFGSLKSGTDYFLQSHVSGNGTVTWQNGKTFSLGDLRDIGTALIVYSFVWQIDGGQAYYDLAHTWLMNVVSWGDFDRDGTKDLVMGCILTGVAFAYDTLYPRLSDSERTQIRQAIANNAQGLMNGGLNGVGRWWEHEYLQNHNWINHESVGFAALALDGEVSGSSTQGWLDYAVENAHRIEAATSGITDGTWHEGLSYMAYAYMWHLPFVTALKRNGHQDLTDVKLLRPTGSVIAHSQIPNAPNEGVLTYADFYNFGFDMTSLRYLASKYGDGVAQAAADKIAATTPRFTYGPEIAGQVYEFLFYDPSVPAADLTQQPLDWRGSDLQAVIFRSGWDKGATLFALKAGTYGGRSVWERIKAGDHSVGNLNWAHDHADDNGFYLYGNESWLAPEAEGYSPAQSSFTFLHNTLVVDGTGQLGEGPRPKGDEDAAYGWFGARESSIPFQGSSAHFAYAVGEGAHLYDASLGLTRWDRHALFLDRKWVILRDVVEATKSHDYTWYSHFMNGASQEGSWIHGRGENGQSIGVAVVAPSDWRFGSSQQSPPRVQALNPKGSVTAATVRPGSSRQNVSFLTALVPVADSSWGSRPKVTPLDNANPDRGLYLTDGTRVAAAIFGKGSGDDVRAGDYHLVGQAAVAEYDGGVTDRALLVQASRIEDKDHVILQQGQPLSSTLEADGLGSSTVTLSGDSLANVTLYAPQAQTVRWYGRSVSFTRQGPYVKVSLSSPMAGQAVAGDASGIGAEVSGQGGGCSTGGPGALAALIPLLGLALRLRFR